MFLKKLSLILQELKFFLTLTIKFDIILLYQYFHENIENEKHGKIEFYKKA